MTIVLIVRTIVTTETMEIGCGAAEEGRLQGGVGAWAHCRYYHYRYIPPLDNTPKQIIPTINLDGGSISPLIKYDVWLRIDSPNNICFLTWLQQMSAYSAGHNLNVV